MKRQFRAYIERVVLSVRPTTNSVLVTELTHLRTELETPLAPTTREGKAE